MTNRLLALALLAGISGEGRCASTVPDRYELHSLGDAAAATQIAQCVGATQTTTVEKFLQEQLDPKSVGKQAQLTNERGSGAAIATDGQWACVRLSQDGFPLWPVESLQGMIVPVGVPAEQVAEWRRKMLEVVGREGVARGLIVYPNGAASQVNVIGEQRQAMLVKFTTRYMKAGDYNPEQFHAVLSHPDIKSLSTQSMGSGPPSRFAIPPQRLRKPLDGEYVGVAPSEVTGNFDFAGTRWKFAGGANELWLQPQGLVIYSSSRSSDSGTWSVDKGVLHVALAGGAHYALTLQPDQQLMVGEGRRVNKPSHEEDDGEWRWSLRLERQASR